MKYLNLYLMIFSTADPAALSALLSLLSYVDVSSVSVMYGKTTIKTQR